MADCLRACLAEVHLDHYHHNFQRHGMSRCDALVDLQMHDYAKFGITSMADRVRLFKLIQSMKSTQAEGVHCQHEGKDSGSTQINLVPHPAAMLQKVDEALRFHRTHHSAMAPTKHEPMINKTSKSTGAAKPGKCKTRMPTPVDFNPSTDLPVFKCRKTLNFDDSLLDTSVMDLPSDDELPTKGAKTPACVSKPADKQISVDKTASTAVVKASALHCSPSLAEKRSSERPAPARPPGSIPTKAVVSTMRSDILASQPSQGSVPIVDNNPQLASSLSKFPPGYFYGQTKMSSSLPQTISSQPTQGLEHSSSSTLPVGANSRSAAQLPYYVQVQPDAHITSYTRSLPSQAAYNPHLYAQPSSQPISSTKPGVQQHPSSQQFHSNDMIDSRAKYGISSMYDEPRCNDIFVPNTSVNKVISSTVVNTKPYLKGSGQLPVMTSTNVPDVQSVLKPAVVSTQDGEFMSPEKESVSDADLASAVLGGMSQGHSDSGIASHHSREASAEKSADYVGFHTRSPHDFAALLHTASMASFASQSWGGQLHTGIVIDKRIEVAQNMTHPDHQHHKNSSASLSKTSISPLDTKSSSKPVDYSTKKSNAAPDAHPVSSKASPRLAKPRPLDPSDILLTMSSSESSAVHQATISSNSGSLSSSQHSHDNPKPGDVHRSALSSYFHHHSREDSITKSPVLMESEYLTQKEVLHSVGYNYGVPVTSRGSPLRSRALSTGRQHQAKTESPQLEKTSNLNDPIRVCVRKRPLNKRELRKKEACIVSVQGKGIIQVKERKSSFHLSKFSQQHLYVFDEVFDDGCTNQMMYERTARPLVQHTIAGGSSTCFAFGQTGAGKTFTLLGSRSMPGLYMLAGRDLCRQLRTSQADSQLRLWLSYYEIYCGHLYDLLNNRKRLYVRENARHQVCIAGLMETQVTEPSQLTQAVEYGNSCRSTGSTGVNVTSSRSHAILQLEIRNAREKKIGRLSFIDLAGSERAADVTDYDRTTRREGAEINQSLLALKECIRALDQSAPYTPYRQSKLTHILRDSFVGNSRTCMIANVSPAQSACEHTLNTLNYANRVKDMGQPPTVTEIATPKRLKNQVPPSLFHPSAITLSSTPKGKPPGEPPAADTSSPALKDASETPIRGHQLYKWHPAPINIDQQHATAAEKKTCKQGHFAENNEKCLDPSVLGCDQADIGGGEISGIERITNSTEKVSSDYSVRRHVLHEESSTSGYKNKSDSRQAVESLPPEEFAVRFDSQSLEKKKALKLNRSLNEEFQPAVDAMQFDGVFSPIPSPSSADLAIMSQHSPMVQPRVQSDWANVGQGATKTNSRRALFQSPKNSSHPSGFSDNGSNVKQDPASMNSSSTTKRQLSPNNSDAKSLAKNSQGDQPVNRSTNDDLQFAQNYSVPSQSKHVISTKHMTEVQKQPDHTSNISTHSLSSNSNFYHLMTTHSQPSHTVSPITNVHAQHSVPTHVTSPASSHVSPGHSVSSAQPPSSALPAKSPISATGNDSLLAEHQAIMGHLDDILHKVKGVISRNASVNEKTVQEVTNLQLEVRLRLSESAEKKAPPSKTEPGSDAGPCTDNSTDHIRDLSGHQIPRQSTLARNYPSSENKSPITQDEKVAHPGAIMSPSASEIRDALHPNSCGINVEKPPEHPSNNPDMGVPELCLKKTHTPGSLNNVQSTNDISTNLNRDTSSSNMGLDKEYAAGFSASKLIPNASLNSLTEDVARLDCISPQTSMKSNSNKSTSNSFLNISDETTENMSDRIDTNLNELNLGADAQGNISEPESHVTESCAADDHGSEFVDTKDLIHTLNKRLLAESGDVHVSIGDKVDEKNSSASTSSSSSSIKKVHFGARTTQVDYNTCDSPLTMSTIIRESKKLKEEALKLCAAGEPTTDGSESEVMGDGHFDSESIGIAQEVPPASSDKLHTKTSVTGYNKTLGSIDQQPNVDPNEVNIKSHETCDGNDTAAKEWPGFSQTCKTSLVEETIPKVQESNGVLDLRVIKCGEKFKKDSPLPQQISDTVLKDKVDSDRTERLNNTTGMIPAQDSTYTGERYPLVGGDNPSAEKISDERPHVKEECHPTSQTAFSVPVSSRSDPVVINRPVIHVVKKFNSPIRKEKLNQAVLNAGFTPIHPQPASTLPTHALTAPAIITKTVIASNAPSMTVLQPVSSSSEAGAIAARVLPSHIEMQRIDCVLHTIKPTPDRADESQEIDQASDSIKPGVLTASPDMPSVPGAPVVVTSNTSRGNIRPERDLTLRVREPVTGTRETLDNLIACHEEQLSNITALCRQEMALLLRVKTGEVGLPAYGSCLQELLTTKINALSALGTRLQLLSPAHPPGSSTNNQSS